MRHRQITGQQMFWLALSSMFPTIVLILPGNLMRVAGPYGWWTPLAAAVPGAIFAWAVGVLAARHGDLVTATRSALGPVLGRGVLFALWVATGIYVVLILRVTTDTSSALFLFRQIPLSVLTVIGLIPSAVLAWLGLVPLGRVSGVMAVTGVAVYVGVLVAALPNAHVIWTQPLLPQGLAFAGWQPLSQMWSWWVEPAGVGALVLFRLEPKSRPAAGRLLALAVLVAAVLMAIGMWVMEANLSPGVIAILMMPFLNLVQGIAFGNLQHLEAIVVTLLELADYIKMGLFFWMWARLTEGLLGGGLRAALLVELGVAGAIGLVLFRNPISVNQGLQVWLTGVALPVGFAAMLLPYDVAAVRGATKGYAR